MADMVGITGIVGTLLGTVVGAFVTWKIQKRQLEHEDRTRFHERRIATYAEFNVATLDVASAVTTPGAPRPTQAIDNVLKGTETLRLIASSPVVSALTAVHRVIQQMMATNPLPPALIAQYVNANAALIAAMRTEIGVEDGAHMLQPTRRLARFRCALAGMLRTVAQRLDAGGAM